jgi:hypothetical protein|tara:strand:+ start:818 stop:1915 length:1098 start_codon:yes stop_codon:yes gene_type:complete
MAVDADWTNGEVLEAADLNDTFLILNTSVYEGFIDGAIGDITRMRSTANDSSKVDTTNSTCLWQAMFAADSEGEIAFCVVFDDADNGGSSAIDSTKWTASTTSGGTGSATTDYTGGYIRVNANKGAAGGIGFNANIISDGASGLDLRSFAGNSEVVFFLDISATESGSGSADARLQISNGTTHVDLFTHTTNGSSTVGMIRLVFNKSGETVDVYLDGSLDQNDVDISTVTTNWYIRVYCDAAVSSNPGSATADAKLYGVGYSKGDGNSFDLVSATSTKARTANAAVAKITYDANGGGSDSDLTHVAYSSNSGSNYTTNSSQLVPTAIGTRSTGVKYRARIVEPSSISATAMNIPAITNFTGFWLG